MFKKIGLGIVALVFLLTAQIGNASAQSAWFDHCQTGLKNTAVYAASAATVTSLIAPVTGASVYICGMSVTQAGGTGTISLEYGTGATCGTGPQTMSATYTANTAAGTPTFINIPNNGYTQLTTNTAGVAVPSQRVCVVPTGTIAQSLSVVYVQE